MYIKMYCPLTSFQSDHRFEKNCMKGDCMWWDEANNDCLVASYLKSKIAESSQLDTQAVASAWYDSEEDDVIEDENEYELTTTVDDYFKDLFDSI